MLLLMAYLDLASTKLGTARISSVLGGHPGLNVGLAILLKLLCLEGCILGRQVLVDAKLTRLALALL